MGVFDSIKNAIFGHPASTSIPTTAAAAARRGWLLVPDAVAATRKIVEQS